MPVLRGRIPSLTGLQTPGKAARGPSSTITRSLGAVQARARMCRMASYMSALQAPARPGEPVRELVSGAARVGPDRRTAPRLVQQFYQGQQHGLDLAGRGVRAALPGRSTIARAGRNLRAVVGEVD